MCFPNNLNNKWDIYEGQLNAFSGRNTKCRRKVILHRINIAGPLGNNAQKSACRRYKNPAATRCTTTKNNDTNYYVLSYMQPIDIHRCKLKLLKVVEASTQKGKLWEKWLLRKPQDIGLTQLPIFLRWQVTQLRFVCLFRQVLHLAFKLQIFPNKTKSHATNDVMHYSSRIACKCCNA